MSIRQRISLLALSVIHFIFLVVLVEGNASNIGVQLVIISSLVFLIVGYVRAPKSESTHSKIGTLIHPFAIAFAGVLTFYLSTDLKLGPVIASAGVGFIASYLSLFNSSFLKSLPVPIYCGTFVGMCSSFLSEDYFFVGYAGLVAGIIYLITRDALNGVGGKLGTIAFGGVVIVSCIFSLL
ncbi:MAG: hypothetical protein AB8B56_11265 [Crocinitomicaceae bacterium]